MGKVMVVAGEVSGDIQAARVVREIKKLAPDTTFFGMGSTMLKKAGVDIIVDPTEISSIGFAEALKNLKIHRYHLDLMKEMITEKNPDVLLLVDYSGFNLKMAKIARKKKVPAVDYFAPSAWIWGAGRAKKMARYGTMIASVFPMERDVYTLAGARVNFVGHPLLDVVQADTEKKEIYQYLELDPDKPVIGLLPGSRSQEISRLLPEMLKAAERLQQKNKDYQFVIPLASEIKSSQVSDLVGDFNVIIKIVEDYTYEVMKIADLIFAASGTATLEAAIMETPMIIVYKTSWSTYQLGSRLMQVDYVGMPNIIAGKEIVPELIQNDATGENIYRTAVDLLNKPYLFTNIRKDLQYIKKMLGEKGAIHRTAKLVLKEGGLI